MDAFTDSTPNLGLTVPAWFDLDAKTRDTLIGSIKRVLQRLQRKGLFEAEIQYAQILRDPAKLQAFIEAFRANRDLARDVALDPKGRPVLDDNTPLICNITLGQVERMLVYTCAKKVLATDGAEIPGQIRSYVAFAWQLPLLEAYKLLLTPEHLRALEDGLLLLKTVGAVRAAAGAEPGNILKTRRIVGDRLAELIEANPLALGGVAHVDETAFERLSTVAKHRVWDLFAADPQVIIEVAGLPAKRLRAFGPDAADLCLASLQQLEDLPEWMFDRFMASLRHRAGARSATVLGDERFANEMLRDIVSQFRAMKDLPEHKRENMDEIIDLKWSALSAKIDAWLDGRPVTGQASMLRDG